MSQSLEQFLEMLGRVLRANGLDDHMEVRVVDEDGETVEDLGTMKLPETKQ